MLLSPIQNSFSEKCGDKADSVMIPGACDGKIIFTLLNEVVVVYVRLIFIQIQNSKFGSSFLGWSKFVQAIGGLAFKTALKFNEYYLQYILIPR